MSSYPPPSTFYPSVHSSVPSAKGITLDLSHLRARLKAAIYYDSLPYHVVRRLSAALEGGVLRTA